MDPQTTWDELLAAYAASEWDRAHELEEELIICLQGGGFPPQGASEQTTDCPTLASKPFFSVAQATPRQPPPTPNPR